jgi:hypothetical protein
MPLASSTHRCRALRADEPPFSQAEDVALKSPYFECFRCFERMFKVSQAHVASVVLQEDVALKAYVASLCFNCFESMLHVL